MLLMPTKNPRLNITVDDNIVAQLTMLSKQEHKSVASVVKELILEALELREDMALSMLAEERDKKSATHIKHKDAWK